MSISKKLKIKNREAIEIEMIRQKLAQNGNISKLVSMYKSKFPEILNTNTGEKWDKLNEIGISKKSYPMAFDRIKSIAKEINGNNIKILDYGFGNGKLEEFLWKRKSAIKELYGIDISNKSVKRATKLFPTWKFINSSQEKLKFKKNYFDFITIMEVLEHISPSHSLNFLKKLSHIIKKDGKLIVSVPLNEPLDEMLKVGNNPNSHVRIYSTELISSELKIAGFNISKVKYLYAFHSFYYLKSLIVKIFPLIHKKPNNLILVAEKI